MQLAVMASRIASGLAIKPRLLVEGGAPAAPPLPMAADHLATIRDAMYAVVNDGGTGGAARLQIPGVAIAGKTGTAQVRRITMAERARGVISNAALPFKLRDHALFIGFAPADAPRYACAIVLEHGGHTVRNLDTPGIGRDIMTYLLDRDRALATLAELEPTWGGDIKTRMAAEAAAYRAQANGMNAVSAAQTEADATAPTDAPAVEAATDAANSSQEAIANDTAAGAGQAAEGSPEPEPQQ